MAISTTDIANPIHVDTVVPGSPSIITTEDRPGIFIVRFKRAYRRIRPIYIPSCFT